MGVSIPVDAKHYIQLKTISDRLDIGLKKTIEYLIGYYLKTEMAKDPLIEAKPVENLSTPKELKLDESQVFDNSGVVSRYETLSEIPSFLAERIITNLPEVKGNSSITDQSPSVTSDFVNDELPNISSQPKDSQNCGICGMPRKSTAKYCYNCGHKLQ